MELREILESVEDPELERTMGQLGMISEVKESRKSISVSIHLPGIGYSQVDELRARIVSGLESAGVKASLEIDFVPMDESEQLELSLKLIGVVGGLAESLQAQILMGQLGMMGPGMGQSIMRGQGTGQQGMGQLDTNMVPTLAWLQICLPIPGSLELLPVKAGLESHLYR